MWLRCLLILLVLGVSCCSAQSTVTSEKALPPTEQTPAPPPSPSTLARVQQLANEHRWQEASSLLDSADADVDAEQAWAASQGQFLVSGGYGYFTVPGIPNSEGLYERRDAWAIMPGTTDAFESKDHVAYQASAQAYMTRFNRGLDRAKSEK